jgi:hypothetical protein
MDSTFLSFSRRTKQVVGVAVVIALSIYGLLSLNYYKSIHPERAFEPLLKNFTPFLELPVDIASVKNDSSTLFRDNATVKIKPDNFFGPGLSFEISENPGIRSCQRVIVKTDLKSTDLNGAGIVMQVQDTTGKDIFWNEEKIESKGMRWNTYAAIFTLDQITRDRAKSIRFFLVNPQKKEINLGDFRAIFYIHR